MVCGLEQYRAAVGIWAGRSTCRRTAHLSPARAPGTATASGALRMALYCATVISTLLVIGGVEKNPGPGMGVDNVVKLVCSVCSGNLKSGTQCDTCEQWFHNRCGNVKTNQTNSGKWSCELCRKDREVKDAARITKLELDLESALRKIEELKKEKEELVKQLNGKLVTQPNEPKSKTCLVIGDSIVRDIGNDVKDMSVICLPGIGTEKLRRYVENNNLGSPDIVIIHAGTNDVRSSCNDYITGDVYDLTTVAKKKFPGAKIVLSGVLRRRDVQWQRVGAINEAYDWVADRLDVGFVDPNSWLQDSDFRKDGLHLNRRGAKRLGGLFSRVAFGGSSESERT